MKNDWLVITVKANPLILEELSELIFNIGSEGVEEKETSFDVYFNIKNWDSKKKEAFIKILEKKDISTKDILYSSIRSQNWNENWKENFKPFRLGSKIIIQPDWEKYQARKDEKVITIAPKMAFGTGHHETTKLILKQMEAEIITAATVLDAGTGSGILAIYAALCGAKKVVAFDFDPEAIANAVENCDLNNVSDKIDLLCTDINGIRPEPYNFIIANINKNVLLDSAESFRKYATESTTLILSGLLHSDKEEIKTNYESNGWIFKKSDQLGEWISLQFVYSN